MKSLAGVRGWRTGTGQTRQTSASCASYSDNKKWGLRPLRVKGPSAQRSTSADGSCRAGWRSNRFVLADKGEQRASVNASNPSASQTPAVISPPTLVRRDGDKGRGAAVITDSESAPLGLCQCFYKHVTQWCRTLAMTQHWLIHGKRRGNKKRESNQSVRSGKITVVFRVMIMSGMKSVITGLLPWGQYSDSNALFFLSSCLFGAKMVTVRATQQAA